MISILSKRNEPHISWHAGCLWDILWAWTSIWHWVPSLRNKLLQGKQEMWDHRGSVAAVAHLSDPNEAPASPACWLHASNLLPKKAHVYASLRKVPALPPGKSSEGWKNSSSPGKQKLSFQKLFQGPKQDSAFTRTKNTRTLPLFDISPTQREFNRASPHRGEILEVLQSETFLPTTLGWRLLADPSDLEVLKTEIPIF